MAKSRREFLRQSACGLTAAGLITSIERFGLVNALAQGGDYKALVCIFLGGGNDSNNMIIPYDNYAEYAAVRDSGANVQIPQESLLQITLPPPSGVVYGLHPSFSALHPLFAQGKLAVVCNVGPLVEPTTRTTYRNGSARRPLNLFSHSDQQFQQRTSISPGPSQTGWGGRVADKMAILNPPGGFPMEVTINETNIFLTGATGAARPLALAPHPTALNQTLRIEGFGQPPSGATFTAMKNLLDVDREAVLVRGASDTVKSAIASSEALVTNPVFDGFPATALGNQLYQVAKLLSVRQTLNLRRQIFFCQIGGFDLHGGQAVAGTPTTGNHANLFTQMSDAMNRFYEVTVELGIASQVTTFLLSDFGRTFKPNGNVGTDHGWGSHYFVMGGSVRGGNFYGTFPSLLLGTDDPPESLDTDGGAGARGRWVPQIAVDQYAATIASWFGVSAADMPAVFPNLNRFSPSNLGFMMS